MSVILKCSILKEKKKGKRVNVVVGEEGGKRDAGDAALLSRKKKKKRIINFSDEKKE